MCKILEDEPQWVNIQNVIIGIIEKTLKENGSWPSASKEIIPRIIILSALYVVSLIAVFFTFSK